MKKSELKTVSSSRIARENLVTLMIIQPSTIMIKILIVGKYQAAWLAQLGERRVSQAGGRGFKPRPNQYSGSLNNWEDQE